MKCTYFYMIIIMLFIHKACSSPIMFIIYELVIKTGGPDLSYYNSYVLLLTTTKVQCGSIS